MKNSNLNSAKVAKNDEFYTLMSDIVKELQHYTEHFKNKIVYCNCDTEESNFYKYFNENYDKLGLRGLIRSSLADNIPFQSEKGVELLKIADIVVTNPPFSLFREFIDLLMKNNKKFLVIGNQNAITYKEVFKYIKDNGLWLGINNPKSFIQPDKNIKSFGNICWFTNLQHNKRNEKLLLTKYYNEIDYPKYDNYAAIEVSKTKDIPINFDGTMGVPITFLDKFNSEQFEIIKLLEGNFRVINGKNIYQRIIIKHKQNDTK